KPADFDMINAILWQPKSLLVREEESAVVIHANAVRRTKTGGQDFRLAAVFAHFQQRSMLRNERRFSVSSGLAVVKIPLGVRLQVHRKFVEMLGNLLVVVEALIEVRLAISVEVAKHRNLVAARYEYRAVPNFESERLIQPGCNPLPRDFAGIRIESTY